MSEQDRILVELVEAQERTLHTAQRLLSVKDELIVMLEYQKRFIERENKVLRTCLYSLVALYSIVFIILNLL
tara:strand:- start:412 stop:627 length:216 start_codon:yes stop_codon:yes gene_type:complete